MRPPTLSGSPSRMPASSSRSTGKAHSIATGPQPSLKLLGQLIIPLPASPPQANHELASQLRGPVHALHDRRDETVAGQLQPGRDAWGGRGALAGVPGAALAKLRRAAEGRVGERELATRRQLVLTLVAMLKQLNPQIKQLERQITGAIREHPDGHIFLSLFKGSTITAAELLAEIGDCRARYPTRDAIAGDAGQAAVAIESGKRKTAAFRWGCNKRLRSAFCTLADTTRHHNPWAQDLYAAARQRGHDHPRALRTVGRAWSRIVWRCWQDRVPYDPARHRALQRHITVTIPTPSGPVPDLAATQRMAGAAVTRRTARRAERAALDRKPTSAKPAGRPAKRRRG